MGLNNNVLAAEPARGDIDALQGPCVLEFGTAWCGHCLAAQPLIAQAFAAHPGISHLKVEDGPGRPLGRSFRVTLWPTLVFLKNGKEITRLIRPKSAGVIADALGKVAS